MRRDISMLKVLASTLTEIAEVAKTRRSLLGVRSKSFTGFHYQDSRRPKIERHFIKNEDTQA